MTGEIEALQKWKLVPIEPTFEMAKAAIALDPKSDLDAKYRAMVAAAPVPVRQQHYASGGVVSASDVRRIIGDDHSPFSPASRSHVAAIDEAWIARFAAWNFATFGPGLRTAGTVDHIRKECIEIEANPHDPKEWVDIILLGINGLIRQGRTPAEIIAEICGKHEVNEARKWPNWRGTDPSKAIEHVRSEADHG